MSAIASSKEDLCLAAALPIKSAKHYRDTCAAVPLTNSTNYINLLKPDIASLTVAWIGQNVRELIVCLCKLMCV